MTRHLNLFEALTFQYIFDFSEGLVQVVPTVKEVAVPTGSIYLVIFFFFMMPVVESNVLLKRAVLAVLSNREFPCCSLSLC